MSLPSKRMKLLILGVALIVALPAVAASASHAWGKYHWDRPTTGPVVLEIGDNLEGQWAGTTYLADASTDWNTPTGGAVTNLLTVPATGGSDANCSPTSGRVEVCNDAYGATGWVGIASIWVKRGKNAHITQGTVKLNDTYIVSGTDWGSAIAMQYVMCQEVGHTFGLGHQDENMDNASLGSCMDYTAPGALVPADSTPNQHDYAQLAEIYAHDHAESGGGGGPPCGTPRGGACASGGGPGNASEHGLPAGAGPADGNVFFTELGNGVTMITHVTWVQ